MSTAKILFFSFITFCLFGMFLLFSMQKNAQLSLDMESMQLISKEKDSKFSAANEALKAAEAKIEEIKKENARIPQLEKNISTIEKEKMVYVQQLDDFQNELQKQVDLVKEYVSKIKSLEGQHASDQQSVAALQAQTSELSAALAVALVDLEEKTLQIEQFADTLTKKERVIQIYKEKLDKAEENIALLEQGDSNEKLNLVLILDELAHKTELAKELKNKLAIANNKAIAAGIDSNAIVSINKKNQELVDKLSLENDNLTTGMKELHAIIKNLESKKAAADELVSSLTAEVEQLQLLVDDKDKALAALQLEADAYAQQINQLSVTISAREEEVLAVKKQAQSIAEPLTEKITGLELQVTQAANQFAGLTDELNQSQSGLSSLEEEKKLLNDELESAKVALESMQNKLSEAENNQTSLQESIATLEQQLASKDDAIEEITVALTAATALATDNEALAQGLNEQLAASKNEILSKNDEQDERIARLIDEVAQAKAVANELQEQTAGLQARNEELLAALAAKETQAVESEAVEAEPETTVEPLTEESAPEEVEPATVTETEVEAVSESAEAVTVEKEEIVEETENTDAGTVVAEEAEEVEETATDEAQTQTEEPVEVPLQDDSANVENL